MRLNIANAAINKVRKTPTHYAYDMCARWEVKQAQERTFMSTYH